LLKYTSNTRIWLNKSSYRLQMKKVWWEEAKPVKSRVSPLLYCFGGIKNSVSNSFKEFRRKSHCKCQGTDLCCQQLCLCEPATCHVGDVWSHPCTLMLPLRIHYSSCCTQTCSSHVLQRLRNSFWCTARRKVTRVLNVNTSGVLQIAKFCKLLSTQTSS
jgi:hypothetical protein